MFECELYINTSRIFYTKTGILPVFVILDIVFLFFLIVLRYITQTCPEIILKYVILLKVLSLYSKTACDYYSIR